MKTIVTFSLVSLCSFSLASDTCEQLYNDCISVARMNGEKFFTPGTLTNLNLQNEVKKGAKEYYVKAISQEGSTEVTFETISKTDNKILSMFTLKKDDIKRSCKKDYDKCVKEKKK